MALDSANAAVAVSGEVYVGDGSSTAPTLTTSVMTSFKAMGYLSEDGIVITPEVSTENLRGWQNAALLRTLITESSVTAAFTMVEHKKDVIEFYWGTTVTQTSTQGTYDIDPSVTGGRKKFVFDIIDNNQAERFYFPEGEVTERGEITNTSGELIGYGVTVTFYPSAALNGKTGRVFDTRLKSVA